jgi:hypothetical protein
MEYSDAIELSTYTNIAYKTWETPNWLWIYHSTGRNSGNHFRKPENTSSHRKIRRSRPIGSPNP